MRVYSYFFMAILCLVVALPSTAKAQLGPGASSSQGREENEDMIKLKKEVTKKANKERQAEIQRDTEKLLKLATELKDYVGKTNENILSVDVIKKADEIEKLAHDVKEKMKTSY